MSRRHWSREALKVVQILGQKIEITVSTDGIFQAKVHGDLHESPTLAGLLPKLRHSAKKTRIKVAVPATVTGVQLFEGSGFQKKYLGMGCVDIVLTGIDPRRDKVQYTRADGAKDERDRFDRNGVSFCKRMPVAEQKRFRVLYDAKRKADNDLYEFEKKWEMDAYKAVQDALTAAVDDPKEAVEEDEADPR